MNTVSSAKVRKMRIDNGWTQDQLAQITSLSYRTIQRIERHGRCSLDSKMALSSAFGIKFSELSSEGITPLDRLFYLRFVQDGTGNFKSLKISDPGMLQVAQHRIVGENCADILPPELSNQILKAIDDLKSGLKSIEFDYSLVLSAGVQFFRAKVIQSEQDSFLSVITEISEQKITEKKLLKNEALLSMMADTLKSGAWEVDLITNEIHWTQQVFTIYEVDKKPTVAEGILFYAPKAQKIIQHAFETLQTSGKSYDLQLPFISAKGKKLWVRVIGWPEYQNAKIIKVSGVIQDITHLKMTNSLPSL